MLSELFGRKESTPEKPKQEPQSAATASPETPQTTPRTELQAEREKLLWRCMEVMKEKFPENMKATGRCTVYCKFPGTPHEAILTVEHDAKDESVLSLTARVLRSGTDMCMMHHIFRGTAEELDAYLADRKNMPELMASWVQLAEQIDKHD